MRAVSTYMGGEVKEVADGVVRGQDDKEMKILNLYPSMRRQTVGGFGMALTSASGHVLNLMDRSEAVKVLESYYSPESGMGMKYVRLCIDSSDFAPYMYEASSSEEEFRSGIFSFENEERFVIPWLEEIRRICGDDYRILFSPWSPPAFMKSNGSRKHGGRLRKEYYPMWAEYFARFLSEYRRRGFNVWALTLQNEPNAVQTWDSCLYSAEEEMQLLSFLLPALEKLGLSDVLVFPWDHNKERLVQRAEVYYSSPYAERISGCAFHGYCGFHFDALSIMRELYPSKTLMLSEHCIPISNEKYHVKQLNHYAHEYLGNLRYGASILLDWNLILDEEGGPNHVGNFCLAPYIYDREGRKLKAEPIFNLLDHVSRAFRPDDRMIASSSYDPALDYAAAVDHEGNVKVVISNPTRGGKRINLRINGKVFTCSLDSGTVSTIEISASDYL